MSKEIWFGGDYHAFHNNIIKYTNRPFNNWWEMNEAIIANHNAVVKPGDDFYHVGDFSLGQPGKTIEFLKRLNGNKFMICGNHDKVLKKAKVVPYYCWLKDYYRLIVQDKKAKNGRQIIILCHYSFRVWDQSHRGSWNLYAHSHGKLGDEPKLLSIDVGIDCHNYRPINYYEIKDIMSKKTLI